MLLAKLKGEPFQTEVRLPRFDSIPPAPAVKELSKACIALVTDGGLYPAGNPDKVESVGATKFGRYDITGCRDLKSEDYEVCHRGYDTSFVAADPDRLVPVDVMRELESEGKIGSLFNCYFATTGVMTTLDNARRIGRKIAAELLAEHIDGVIITST